jgi:hypothetical protein
MIGDVEYDKTIKENDSGFIGSRIIGNWYCSGNNSICS